MKTWRRLWKNPVSLILSLDERSGGIDMWLPATVHHPVRLNLLNNRNPHSKTALKGQESASGPSEKRCGERMERKVLLRVKC